MSLNGYYDIDSAQFFIWSKVTSTRGHSMKLFKSHTRLNIRSNFFTWVIGRNSLPDEFVIANSIGSFKAKLDEYWRPKGYGYEQRFTPYYYVTICPTNVL